MIRLTEWCKQKGISYVTGWRLRRDGKFPFPVKKVGRYLYVVEDEDLHSVEKRSVCPHCGKALEMEVFLRCQS
jgi:predicted site-specific integrase-resolvase